MNSHGYIPRSRITAGKPDAAGTARVTTLGVGSSGAPTKGEIAGMAIPQGDEVVGLLTAATQDRGGAIYRAGGPHATAALAAFIRV